MINLIRKVENYKISGEAMKFPYGQGYLSEEEASKNRKQLVNTIAIPGISIVKKGKQTIVIIFTKEFFVAVFFFANSKFMNVDPDLYCPSSLSPEVYQCCISRSNNSGFKESLKSPSPILDSILKLKGGSCELTDEEMEKLISSTLAKTPQSSHKEISINKFLKRILKVIEPISYFVK